MKNLYWTQIVLAVCVLASVSACRVNTSGDGEKTTIQVKDGDDEASIEFGGIRIDKDGIEIEGSASGRDSTDEGTASGRIRIGRDGVQIRGDADGRDGGGSGSVTVGADGVRVEGAARDQAGQRRQGSVGVGPGGIVLDASALPESCQELCDGWGGVRQSQAACTIEVLEDRNHPLSRTSTCQSVGSDIQCVACAGSLQLSERDCSAVLSECF